MDQACQEFRQRWIEDAHVARAAHAEECAACRAWLARSTAQVAGLVGLARHAAPVELEQRLFPLREAPESAERSLRRLRELSPLRAPAVLERLVAEELAAPESARARRFAGDLARQATPQALERRLFAGAAPAQGLRRRFLAGAAAAAVLLVLLTAEALRAVSPAATRARPFLVHRAAPPELHPMLGGLVGLADARGAAILRPQGEPAIEEEG
jgi:hypothetical protein